MRPHSGQFWRSPTSAAADQCGCQLVEMHEEPDDIDNVTHVFVFEKR